ncbi:hypothetical protein, conserved [Eimeria praecox]|uniref:Uncharacterized protein n=1 Tax=Eimeria praecox TaxID=51316 RepID=U6H2Z5_9EIME|nr:hypothetical protein, conserved [Eimeria praecox]
MASTEIGGEELPRIAPSTGYGAEEATRDSSNTDIPGHLSEDYENPHLSHSVNTRPVLPVFWGNAQESPHRGVGGEASCDVWRELNSDSPSILRLQCLWAYFNLPALSLADSVAGVASVAAQTDGFRSVVQVSSPLLHVLAVDLRGAGEAFEKAVCLRDQHMIPSLLLVRNVPAVRIQRVYDVFQMADGFELGDSSGLFVIGTTSRTIQPEYLLDAAMDVFGGPFGQLEGEGEYALDFAQREDEVTGSTAIPICSEENNERETPSSFPEGEQLDDDEDNKPPHHAFGTGHTRGSSMEHNSCFRDIHQQHLQEADYIISAAQSEVNDPAQSRPGGFPVVAISDEPASAEDEHQSAKALEDEKSTATINNEATRMYMDATTSDGEQEFGASLAEQFASQYHHEASDAANTNTEDSCPVETSNTLIITYDRTIEKQLQLWIATKGEVQSYKEPPNVFERSYPSHEFEYWAVEDILVTVEQNYESDEPGTLSVSCGDEVFLFSVTVR